MSVPQVISKADPKLCYSQEEKDSKISPHISIEDCPDWFTQEYLESCLSSHYKDYKLKIIKLQAKPALGKGENYGGILTRIKAEYQFSNDKQKTGYYILKSSYEADEFAREMMEPYDIFNREIEIYEKVLPQFKLLLQEISDSEQIFAETMSVDKESSALLFEDLNEREFIMPDRLQGLDKDVTKIVLRKLAKMHACSAVLNERQPHCLEHYDKGMFNRYTENYKPCFAGCLEACIRKVKQWPDFKKYSDKLTALYPRFMELGKQVFDPIPTHLNVFAHGDLWTNNILVKYDKKSKKPLDAIIIDFQYSVWTSPAVDLFYFLNTSLQEDLDLNDQDELIQGYYHHLRETLEKLQFKEKIPSLQQFLLQLQEKDFYAFHSSCVIQSIQRNTENENADFNALMQTDERALSFKDTCYNNPYMERVLRKRLPIYERRGLLDVDQ